MVVARLVERSLPKPEICGLNPNIGTVLSTNCKLNRKDENGPSFKKQLSSKQLICLTSKKFIDSTYGFLHSINVPFGEQVYDRLFNPVIADSF